MTFIAIFISILSGFYAQDTIKVNRNAGVQEEVFTLVETMPEYPGGMKNLYKFISTSVKFPLRLLQDSSFVSCTVFVKFIIDNTGLVRNPVILKGCSNCLECDEEALRVIKQMPKWKPAEMNGRPVNSYFNLPVRFKIQ